MQVNYKLCDRLLEALLSFALAVVMNAPGCVTLESLGCMLSPLVLLLLLRKKIVAAAVVLDILSHIVAELLSR